MARYIDADLIPYSDDDDYLSQYTYRYDINEIPTADVVPKSEVEVLEAELSRYTENVKQMCEQAKADVARAIFAEIQEDCFDQFGYFDYDAFAELKKKYIPKNCRTCKHMLSCEPNVFGICEEYEEKET